MTALIDADIVAFRCAASAENEPVEIALLRVEAMMMEILGNELNYKAFLTGPNNFRYKINLEYKANRKGKPKPIHLEACRYYLETQYQATVTDGYEADDALGMNQTAETTIYSIDKDLLMIPGCHYNFVKKEYTEVTELEALKTFYKQMLIGDASDNINGVEGIGKVKAARIIDPLETEEEMFQTVFNLYTDSDTTFNERFWMNANCLWIWRNDQETYTKRMDRGAEEKLHSVCLTTGEQALAS